MKRPIKRGARRQSATGWGFSSGTPRNTARKFARRAACMESSLKAPIYHRDWKILLVGGSSGVGKTLIAREIGLRFGIPWLQVDDLRLAFQWSHVTLPEHSDALYLFQNADRWQLSPEEFCKG